MIETALWRLGEILLFDQRRQPCANAVFGALPTSVPTSAYMPTLGNSRAGHSGPLDRPRGGVSSLVPKWLAGIDSGSGHLYGRLHIRCPASPMASSYTTSALPIADERAQQRSPSMLR